MYIVVVVVVVVLFFFCFVFGPFLSRSLMVSVDVKHHVYLLTVPVNTAHGTYSPRFSFNPTGQ